MEPESNNDSDSQDLESSQRIHQNVIDAQHQVNQQAVVGDNNILQHGVGIAESKVNVYFGTEFKDLIPKVSPDSGREKTSQDRFIDPTTELQLQNEVYPDVVSSEIHKHYRQKLIENRLIFISCSDQEISWKVGCALADSIEAYNKRLLTGEKDSLKYFDTISIETLLDRRVGKDESTIFVVDTAELQTFLDSVTVRQPSRANEIRNALRSNQKFCICLVEPKVLKLTLGASSVGKLLFDYWEIQEQEKQDYKLFIDNSEHFNKLTSELQNGRLLTKIVLFTASFFPQLSVSDFEKIVTSLGGNQSTLIKPTKANEILFRGDTKTQTSILIEGEKIVVNKSDSPKTGYNLDQIDVDNSVSPHCNNWELDLDNVLDSCYLTFVPGNSSGKVIDFDIPDLREKLVAYFEKKYSFLNHQFQTLVNLGFLIDASPKLSKYTREIAIKIILYSNEEEYRRRWLDETVSLILCEENNNRSPKTTAYHFKCIAELLRELLNYPELENLVNQVLDELIASRQHDAVLEIAKRLRFAPQFNELFWFKQLIARSTDSVQLATYRTLSNELKQNKSRLYESLEEIRTWLPKLNQSSVSRLNQFALQLLPEYILEMLAEFESNSWDIPTVLAHPLFSGLQNSNTALAKSEVLVSWLLHPKLNSVTGDDVDPIGLVAINILPKLLLAMRLVENIDQQPELELMENYFIQGIVNVADFYQKETGIKYKQSLLGYWEGWTKYLKIQVNHLKLSREYKSASKWNHERNVVRYLIKRFQALSH